MHVIMDTYQINSGQEATGRLNQMSNIAKEVKIMSIEKSWKYEGYCFIKMVNEEKYRKRKVYERKTGKLAGKFLVNLNTDVYSFTWGADHKAKDIEWIGSYKDLEDIDKEDVAEIVQDKVEDIVKEVKQDWKDGKVFHNKFHQIKTCIENSIPVYLAGPAGSGKNHTLEQIAEALELDFHFTNSVQQEYKLTGFIDAGGKYHETEFYKAFKDGGLFFLDEMDASIPEVLVLLNAAIANGYFEFPNGKITAHEDFRVVAAGNTVGSGADETYTGRMVLDQATLDRFVIIEFDYDQNIEVALSKGNLELVNFIRELRVLAQSNGIRATFSYRCITQVTKLEAAGMDLQVVLAIAVFKGLDKDTIKTFKPTGYSKYTKALNNLKAA